MIVGQRIHAAAIDEIAVATQGRLNETRHRHRPGDRRAQEAGGKHDLLAPREVGCDNAARYLQVLEASGTPGDQKASRNRVPSIRTGCAKSIRKRLGRRANRVASDIQ